MRIHAFRRKEPIAVTISSVEYAFSVNERGDVVADVPDESAAQRLLEIDTDYRAYGQSAETGREAVTAPGDGASDDAPAVVKRRGGRPPKTEQL